MENNAGQERQTPELYEINTQIIYYDLKNHWRKYDIEIINAVEEAVEWAHRKRKIMTYYYRGDDDAYMNSKIEGHLEGLTERNTPTDPDGYPIEPYYYGGYYKDKEYIVSMAEPCKVERDYSNFDLLFAVQFSLTSINKCEHFLNYQLSTSFNNEENEFITFMENICLEYKSFLADKHEVFYRKWIKEKTQVIENAGEKEQIMQKVKLNWLGSPSQFAYIFLELAKKGFIEIPSTNGEASYSKYAKVCWDLFDFQTKTTLENLVKEMNPKKSTLSESVRTKFTIPSLNEISKKQKP